MVGLLLALTISVVTGYLLVELLLPRSLEGLVRLLTSLSLGIGVGLGISSINTFVNLLFFGRSTGLILMDLAILVLVLLICIWTKRLKLPIAFSKKSGTWKASTLQKITVVSFGCVLALSVFSFVGLILRLPHGRWDAWVLWNTKARFLFAGGDQWRALFSQLFQDLTRHPDYPLLLPLNVARGWVYFGDQTVVAPILIASLFAAGVFILLYGSLTVLRSRGQALIAVMVLLGSPYFIRQSAALETDVPLAFFFLATTVLLLLHGRLEPAGRRLLILSGLMASLGAWTKNEGLLFLVVVALAQLAVQWKAQGWKNSLSRVGTFALGALPVTLVVYFFKVKLALSTVHLASQTSDLLLSNLTDISRYKQILISTTVDFYNWGDWYINPLLLIALYPLCLGISSLKNHRPILSLLLLILGIMALGYFATLLITPYDLTWHLETTVKRLILHVWPISIVLYFLIVKTPEESLGARELDSTPSITKGSPSYA